MVDERRTELTQLITGQLLRRYSTATVLFHHAVAERSELAPIAGVEGFFGPGRHVE